jgi:Zn-dependent peptidase ImmA (M78 family)
MERLHVGGRGYRDPDVLSLIRSGREPIDPRVEVIRRARALVAQLQSLGPVPDPRSRIEILASLAGIKVTAMSGAGVGQGSSEALVYHDVDGSRRAFYDPTYSEARINFSIAHEIIHAFFPNSSRGARFRSLSAEGSREANELERLCDLGAAELLMPTDEFLSALGGRWGLERVPELCQRFGSSFEATVYRLATTSRSIALAGLVRFRRRKEEERLVLAARQQELFATGAEREVPNPKYRRQSLHVSDACAMRHTIPWNKSFDPSSLVYRAAHVAQTALEELPNRESALGLLEAVIAPYQRVGSDETHPDVLFLWRKRT